MSSWNIMLSWVEHEKKFYNLGAWPLDKSPPLKISFVVSQPKHMLGVLKRTISMRWFFWAPKTNVKIDG